MLDNHIWCVVMAGGSGTRFWPVSTAEVPKQFLPIKGDADAAVPGAGMPFLKATVGRFDGLVPPERTLVVANRRHEALVRGMLPELPSENILLEPYNRDTAPCIAYAMYTILKRDPEGIMVVVPSDHLILEEEKFRSLVEKIASMVPQYDVLTTIGISPTRPDTNYGYIQADGIPEDGEPIKVKTFTEKPDPDLAEIFVQSGDFLWNSGIFVWKADTLHREFHRHMPQISGAFRGWQGALDTPFQEEFLERAYADAPKISIDYAILERSDKVWTFPSSMGWYDTGTWESLYSFRSKDADGNVCTAKNSIIRSSKGNLFACTDPSKLVAVQGLENYIVVDTGKVLLICPRDDRKFRDFLSNLALPQFEPYR